MMIDIIESLFFISDLHERVNRSWREYKPFHFPEGIVFGKGNGRYLSGLRELGNRYLHIVPVSGSFGRVEEGRHQ